MVESGLVLGRKVSAVNTIVMFSVAVLVVISGNQAIANPCVPVVLSLSTVFCDVPMTDVTLPGDTVIGYPDDGNWPGGEAPPLAIDDDANTKYLHFGGQFQSTGIRVTPSQPGTVIGGVAFTTANDEPDRDPIAFEVYGSNSSISSGYELIASGEIADFKQGAAWPRFTRNSTPITFINAKPYNHYQVLLTAVRNSGANSMQVAEIELLGIPEGGWPPAVEAGEDRVAILPYTSINLDGIVQYYGDNPELLTIEWSLEDAPDGVSIEDLIFVPSNLVEDPTVELPPVAGTYTFKLFASDQTADASDTMQIAVVESMCPTGDLDNDCAVDFSDLRIFAANWLWESMSFGSTVGDLNGKDGVNMVDYSLLLEDWNIQGPTMVINEFMAINNSKHPLEAGELLDEDMESSDWIELYNTTGEAISLKGWYLTDDATGLTGWEFPGVTIESDESIIVFASGQDRDDPEGQLHTDFVIGSSAGYLGLVKPDGNTVVHSYDYPQQFAGTSYGLTAPGGGSGSSSTVELVPEGSDAFALIPQDGSLGMTWTDPEFDHAGWKSGQAGVGYDYDGLVGVDVGEMWNVNESVYVRIPFEISDLSDLRNLKLQMKYDDGFIAYLNNDQPVASANDPADPTWNSGTEFDHPDGEAVNFVDFPLPEEYLSHLRIGTNVLAIQGFNRGPGSSDLLILPRLTVERASDSGSGSSIASMVEGFFPYPSPDAPNNAGIANLGPAIRNVTENPPALAQNEGLLISAEVVPTYDQVSSVSLFYRVDFGGETEVDMTADAGVYSATIPASAYSSGQMVRWYVKAQDDNGVVTREPMFIDADNGPEYFGTVVTEPSINTNLQVFTYFVENTSAAGSRNGTRASVYFLDEFYDNVFIRLRGGNTTHGRKFAFNDGHHFRFDPSEPRVDEINVNEKGSEPTYIRQPLSWETYELAGLPASISFPLHVRRNGSFHAVRIFVEQPDTHLIEREGMDPRGALYKVYSDLGRISGEQVPRKKSRLYEDTSDLQELVNGISSSNPTWAAYVFDNVNIPAVINYMASSVLVHENDHTHKNFFMYRDTEGTGEWMFLPWDKDLTFGINNGIGGIIADQDWPEDELRSPSHPFYGDSTHQKIDHQWNRLFDAITRHPVTRKMYLRRFRTLMDDILQPASTPLSGRYYENRIDEFVAMLDIELGGASFYNNVNNIKTQYLDVRRTHFFENHSIHNPGYPGNAGIPDAQPAVVTVNIGNIEYGPASNNQDAEYIELTNPAFYAVDISGWKLDNAVSYEFTHGTVIPGGGTLYAVADAKTFRARTVSPKGGEKLFVQGNYRGHLSSWGETVELYDADGNLVTSKTYTGTPSDAQRYLRISEIMYHPQNPEAGSEYNDEDFEYIELVNTGDSVLSLSGVKFTEGMTFAFAEGDTLAAGEYLLIAKNPAAFSTRYAVDGGVEVFGPYDGSLSNAGESIKLEDATNSTILEFSFKDGWYEITDGDGFSLTFIDVEATSHDDWGKRSNWRTSTFKDGTPGSDDVGPAADSVVINEILAHSHDPNPQNPTPDWIELKNTTDDEIDISGWFMTDNNNDDANRRRFEFPAGTTIPANGYIVFYEDETFGNVDADGCNIAFGLSEGGETLYVYSGLNGEITGYYSTEQKFGASDTNVTLGRYEKESLSSGYDFVSLVEATAGYENSLPAVGPIVITEIMYNPADDNQGGEYIELYNSSDSAVELMSIAQTQLSDDPADIVSEYLPWKLTDAIEFTFPDNTVIGAGEYLIVAKDTDDFKLQYPTVPELIVLGPFDDGKLNNGGDNVKLSQPGDEEWEQDRYYIVLDRAEYKNESPWPESADGTGPSLNRIDSQQYANDPENWQPLDANPNE